MVASVTELDHSSAPKALLPTFSSAQLQQSLGRLVLGAVRTLVSRLLANATGFALTLGASSAIALNSLGRDEAGAVTSVTVCPVRGFHLKLPGQKLAQKLATEKDPNLGLRLGNEQLATPRRIQSFVGKAHCEKISEACSTVLVRTRQSYKVIVLHVLLADQARSNLG